jgi:hypothetical protein
MTEQKLETTEREKDVGLIVTKNQKPSTQCHNAAPQATAVLNQLRKNFHCRDRRNFAKLYKKYVPS